MNLTRRDFLKASGALAGALALKATVLMQLQQALAAGGGPPVVWLQGQGCTGCSVSLLNTIHYMTVDDLLINTLDLNFHPTVMAAAGDLAVGAAVGAPSGYVLVIEGAIPTGSGGDYCHIWPGMTMLGAVESFAQNAGVVLAVGTCACYGGMSAGWPNPTGAKGVQDILGSGSVINIPGCPAHPDWIVGTVAALLAGGMPVLDSVGRPIAFFGEHVHYHCPNREGGNQAKVLGDPGCLASLGCNGQQTHADCPVRKWNASAQGGYGVNWCVGARNPCQGCTEPDFPDGMSPFYKLKRADERQRR